MPRELGSVYETGLGLSAASQCAWMRGLRYRVYVTDGGPRYVVYALGRSQPRLFNTADIPYYTQPPPAPRVSLTGVLRSSI